MSSELLNEQYHRDLAKLAMYGNKEAQETLEALTGMGISKEALASIHNLQWAMLNSMWYAEEGFPMTQGNTYNYPCDPKHLLTNNKKYD